MSGTARTGLTHFIRIPLSTAIARRQLDTAYSQIMMDPVAAGIPKVAFVSPSRLHLHIGGLRLPRPSDIDAASRHLMELDLRSMLRDTLAQTKAENPSEAQIEDSTTHNSGIVVNIHGLRIYGRSSTNLSARQLLWAPVIDAVGMLPLFCHNIAKNFKRTGLLVICASQPDPECLDQPWPTYTPIIDTRRMRIKLENFTPEMSTQRISRTSGLTYDITELYPKYCEFTWAKDVQLEKLSICKSGPRDIMREGKKVGEGYEEIASVPLPGAPSVSSGPELEGDTFGGQRKHYVHMI